MDIYIDSDEDQVDTWSGGIPGGMPKTTTVAPEVDDHKESSHFFPNNQQVTVHFIKNRNMLPEGALTDDVLDAAFPSPIIPSNKFFSSTSTSFRVAHPACKIIVNVSSKLKVRSSRNSQPKNRNPFVFERIETKLSLAPSSLLMKALRLC
jgi:hypothetical protein